MSDAFLEALDLEIEIGAEIERSYLEQDRDLAELNSTERLLVAEAHAGAAGLDFIRNFFRGFFGG